MNGPRRIPHRAIQASAGSGKTYRLAHRYIRLLAEGVAPDTIVALTFSRKAAGEILTDVVKYLREAAVSPEAAERHARDMGAPGFTADQFRASLRAMTDALHRLHIGTLDSFIVGILRAFALELGLGTDIQIMNDNGSEASEIRLKIRASVFASSSLGDEAHRQFRDAIRQATFGREEKRLGSVLDEVIKVYWPLLREAPEAASWGDSARIWTASGQPPWEPPSEAAAREAAGELCDFLENATWDARLRKKLIEFVQAAAAYGPLSRWDDDMIRSAAVARIIEGANQDRCAGLQFTYYKKAYGLDARQMTRFRVLVSRLFGIELQRALSQTRGMYQFLSLFDGLYDRVARRRGALTFQDAQYLLTPSNAATRGATLSRDPSALLYVDFRMDCRLNHWLLDEFQDTSDLQWSVLANLANEILQDGTGERSFFYVGDVKQSIYGWRGGNPRLFDDVRAPYPAEWIGVDRQSVSYRSCESVIAAVNRVFTELPEEIPAAVRGRWREAWERHTTAAGLNRRDGEVVMIELAEGEDGTKPSEEQRYRAAAGILNKIDPLGRGLTVAALVRSNAAGKALANALRQECPGRMIVHEGPASILDNPVVALLLSLIQYAVHPADLFAWRHIQMSPLPDVLRKHGLNKVSLPLFLLRQIHATGLEEVVRWWGDELAGRAALSAFERKRLEDLAAAAASFDQRRERDGDAFLRFMAEYEVDEPASENAVRVMTVHQAKGLEFDLVILADLQPGRGGDITKADTEVLAGGHVPGSPPWILTSLRKVVAESDPVLAAVLERENADSCYEELCVLYVAMTRAKRGLYIVTGEAGKTSKSFTPAAFLRKQLASDAAENDGSDNAGKPERELFRIGNPDWYKSAVLPAPEAAAPAPVWPADFAGRESRRRTLKRVEPSGREERERKGAWFFSAEARDVLEFGSAIHEMFQRVTWIDESDADALAAEWASGAACGPAVRRDAVEQFKKAMSAPEVRAALARPAGRAELWREKRFDLVEGRDWITGTFDRVVIRRDGRGEVEGAEILDFKSDRVRNDADIRRAAETYRGQMTLYRVALCRMLGCPGDRIAVKLLFTRVGRVAEV